MSITGHSISHWLPCPVPSWVPNTIGTWGGNSINENILPRYCATVKSILFMNKLIYKILVFLDVEQTYNGIFDKSLTSLF